MHLSSDSGFNGRPDLSEEFFRPFRRAAAAFASDRAEPIAAAALRRSSAVADLLAGLVEIGSLSVMFPII